MVFGGAGAPGSGLQNGGGGGGGACPEGLGFCGIFVANDCSPTSGGVSCAHRPLPGLSHFVMERLESGVTDEASTTRVEGRDGVFFAAVPRGAYRLHPQGARFESLLVMIEDAPIVLDCRSPTVGRARLVGRVRIAVSGGAEGNTTVSDGGPGKFLVVSVLRMLGEQQLDRASLRFAITDENGAFQLALAPGRYYVSDVSEARESGRDAGGQNATPISGRAIDVTDGATIRVQLTAHAAAP